MKWGLVIASRAKRQFRRLSADERDGIDQAFSEMCDNPFQGDVKFLRGLDTMRRRVGDWRILYELNEAQKLIVVTAIKRRGSTTYLPLSVFPGGPAGRPATLYRAAHSAARRSPATSAGLRPPGSRSLPHHSVLLVGGSRSRVPPNSAALC
jgi:mRNA interferase RelE/StbE